MRWMMRRMRTGDRGAIVVLVTIVTTLVLLGAGALVMNSGSWYAERAQLQNGADSAALAVAQSCAQGTCTPGIASGLANHNANDNLSTVDYVCGGKTADVSGLFGTQTAIAGLNPCSAATPSWTATGCPAPPKLANALFVNVHTSTKTGSGSTIPVIGDLTGKPEHIKACAQASWGYPGGATVAPFTMSQCEYVDDTGSGGGVAPTFATAPPYTNRSQLPVAYPYNSYDPGANPAQVPTPGGESVIPLHGTANLLSGGTFDTGTDNFAGTNATLAWNTNSAFTFGGTAGSLGITWKPGAALADTVSAPKQALIVGTSYTATAWVLAPTVSGQPQVALYVNSTATHAVATVLDGSWDQVTFTWKATQKNNNVVGITNTSAVVGQPSIYIDEFSVQPTINPHCQGVTPPTNPPSGWDQPGGFGWLSDNGSCSVNVNVNNTIWDQTGASLPPECKTLLSNASCTFATVVTSCQPSIIYVPIFDYTCSNGSGCDVAAVCGTSKPPGSNGCYHFSGFAGFVPSGFQLNGSGGLIQKSFISNKGYCTGNDKCVYGYFVGKFAKLPNEQGGGGPFGLPFVGLTG